jgi:hypothetical protein
MSGRSLTAAVVVKQMPDQTRVDHRTAMIDGAKLWPNLCNLLVTRARRTKFIGYAAL